jgi:hypothetical protein
MTRPRAIPRRRQYSLSWGVLLSFAVYMLSLCTLSPFVHADTLRRSIPGQHNTPGHCTQPPGVPLPSAPFTPDHEKAPAPLCCELRGWHNKALSDSFADTDFLPLLVHLLLPFDAIQRVNAASSLHHIQALRFSRPPPLYLSHAALLL